MNLRGSGLNLLFFYLIWICVLFLFKAPLTYSGIIFHDDFESQSSTWNIGKGPLTTPSGSEGHWERFEYSSSCSDMCCNKGGAEDCSDLPSWAGDKLTFIWPTKGYGGGKCVGTSLKYPCNNRYPGAHSYVFEKNYKEIYIGFHYKFEEGFSKDFSAGCKTPLRFFFTTEGGSPHFFISYKWGSFKTSGLYAHQPAGPFSKEKDGKGYHYTGIGPKDIYDDHNWHWLEFRIKLNTDANTLDGEFEAWVDGVKKTSISGTKYHEAKHGNSIYFKNVFLKIGNCSTCPNLDCNTDCPSSQQKWEQQTWKAVLFDNFTVSTSYIGPSGYSSKSINVYSSGGALPNSNTVSTSSSSSTTSAPPAPGKPWVID